MKLDKVLYEAKDKIKLLEIIKDHLDLATELCHSPEEELPEKCVDLIKDKFSEVKDKLKDDKIFEKLLESKDVGWLLGFDREKAKERYLKLISECEDTIQRRDFSEESRKKLIKLCGLLSPIEDEITIDIQRNMKILALLAQIEDVCSMLKRFKDFDISIGPKSLNNLIEFTRRLIDELESQYFDIDIPKDDSISCLLYMYELFKSFRKLNDDALIIAPKVSDFLLLLSVTSEVLRNEGLSSQDLDKYMQTFEKIFRNVYEKVSVSGREELKSLRESLINYFSSALRVSQIFNIDNEMHYHTYIIDKLLSSHIIGVKDLKKVADLYKTIVDELTKEREYGDKYILSLLRLIVIAVIQQRFYRVPTTLTESWFKQILLEIIKFVNKMCDNEAIKNFDKILNYSIYSSDLEYLEGFIDFLYSLYLRKDYDRLENALKDLNFF